MTRITSVVLARRAAAIAVIPGIAVALAAPASAKVGAPIIKYGSTGQGVTCVQEALDNYDVVHSNFPYLTVDGKDGPATTTAIKVFQWYYHLTKDGIVGPQTGGVLLAWAPDSSCYKYIPTSY